MHLTAVPTPLPKLRPDLSSVPLLCEAVLKAIAKEKSARFQTVQEFAAAMQLGVQPAAALPLAAAAAPSEPCMK